MDMYFGRKIFKKSEKTAYDIVLKKYNRLEVMPIVQTAYDIVLKKYNLLEVMPFVHFNKI